MNRRLAKEFRILALPAGFAALATLVLPLEPLSAILHKELGFGNATPFLSLLAQWMPFFFVLGFTLLAALPFGAEFQLRTLPLLLGQPEARFRIWREKMLLMAGLSVGVSILLALMASVSGWLSGLRPEQFPIQEIISYVLVMVGVVCASGWWTLVARSTIGGIVFNFMAMFLIGGATTVILDWSLQPVIDEHGLPRFPHRELICAITYTIVDTTYSALGLWLGWRKFSRMELRDAVAGEGLNLPAGFPGVRWISRPFRCRPTGSFRNLIRKEFWLHRTLFSIAAIFTACWLLTFGSMILLTVLQLHVESRMTFEVVFNVLTVAYIALLTLLAGCISLAEEKSLGLAAWHLTLPTPSRRSWLLKLFIAAGLLLLLGLLLPFGLATLTSSLQIKVGLAAVGDNFAEFHTPAGILLLAFGVSFWAASFSSNVVRSIVTTIAVLSALGLLVSFASWCANQFNGLQSFLLWSIMAFTQSYTWFWNAENFILVGIVLVFLIVMFVALRQSLAQFRRAQLQSRDLKRNALLLAGVVFVGTFWCADFANSILSDRTSTYRDGEFSETGPSFVIELTQAAVAVWQAKPEPETKQSFSPSLQELEQTGKLSGLAKVWLRNAKVTVDVDTAVIKNGSSRGSSGGQTIVTIKGTVLLPNGTQFPFSYWKYKTEPKP